MTGTEMEPASGGGVTAAARMAAALDARGLSPKEIADITGCNAGSVKRWRTQDAYCALRDEYREKALVKFDGPLNALRIDLIKATHDALPELVKMTAEHDSDGNIIQPQVRLEAMRQIANHPVLRALVEQQGKRDDGSAGANATAALHVHINDSGEISVAAGQDYIEGSARDVTDR